jgi:crotonobetainyl-CoA:carnitine CoA-transferase CaiB-like acyl-CoA transferase
MNLMAGPISHVRVLDLSRVLAGPWASQTLADLGAEVIKVERPGTGDDTRAWGPPFLHDCEGNQTHESAYYLSTNRGKKSVAIDFTQPEGQELVRKLAAKSDILLENFKVGGLAKYNLDYQSLRDVNPGLIYCSITGFGQTGPYRHRSGYDFLLQGMGGLMSITGEPDGEPGGGPMKVGVAIVDLFTGMYATTAILAALAHRERCGRGQYIDLALLDVQVATLANQASNFLVANQSPSRMGNTHPNIVPYQAFATKDGHIILAVGNDQQFRKLCTVIGHPALAEDERYATNAARVYNRVNLGTHLKKIFTQQTSTEWIDQLEKVGVPCGPINTLEQVFDDPQVKARRMRIELPHRYAETVSLVGSPMKFSDTPVVHKQGPPVLGEHSNEVLGDLLGLGEEDIRNLHEAGIVEASGHLL